MPKRFKTNYPGVFYREVNRIGKKGTEKVYYIVFKKDGKVIEEKVGRQYKDNITPAVAASIRGERVEGKRKSRREIKAIEEAKRLSELNKWTINRLWAEYKSRNPNLKGIVQDDNRFTNYIKPNFGAKEPRELSPFDVDKFRVQLLKQKKPATVKNILEVLRRIISFGVKKRLCEGINFTIEMPKVNNQKTEDLTPIQLARLLEVLNQETNLQAANLMKLALFTGMRRGELFRLKWNDVDFERGFIFIRDPKGGLDEKIPLNSQVKSILQNHQKTHSPFVFPGRGGRQRTDIKRQVNYIKEKAGLPKSFRAIHGLRHVFASILASSGKVDMYTLQKLLTHKSANMTQRYAHLRDESLKNASNLAGDLILNNNDYETNNSGLKKEVNNSA